MENMSKCLRCPKCGKKMKEIVSQEASRDWGVIRTTIPYYDYLLSLPHFECPEKHVGVILIPVTDDQIRRLMKKQGRPMMLY
jgi:hypothetical protein